MFLINLKKNNDKYIPDIQFDKNISASTTQLAIILYWLENGLYTKPLWTLLNKELDKSTIKEISQKFLSLKDAVENLNTQQKDLELLEAAKTPIIPADSFLPMDNNN